MFVEVKLGEADYTVVYYNKVSMQHMNTIDCADSTPNKKNQTV